jgi:RNA polymerase sigma factor (sigma-70 family)
VTGDLQDLDDASLVQRCLAGKQDAWRALVQRYQRLVFTVARRARLDEHAAADVLQTVFARLFEHLPRLSQPDRLHAWLVTTARRETLAVLRHAHRFAAAPVSNDDDADAIAQIPDAAPLAEELLQDLQESQAMRVALDRLDARCRDLLTMLFADEEERPGYDQVSLRLGMPEGSIGPTRSRCLDKLRRLYLQKPRSGERE